MEEVSWNEHRPSWTKCGVPWKRLSRAYWMGQPADGFCQDMAEGPVQKGLQDAKIVLALKVLHDTKIAPVSRERVKNGALDGIEAGTVTTKHGGERN